MADSATIDSVEKGVTKRLMSMVKNCQTIDAYLNGPFLKKFQTAQIKRFETENSSEGKTWAPLNPAYKKWKLKKFAAYPGGGNVIMVREDRLRKGAQAQDSQFYYKIVTQTQFVLGVSLDSVPYAAYAGESRPYMQFSDETISKWKKGIASFIRGQGGS